MEYIVPFKYQGNYQIIFELSPFSNKRGECYYKTYDEPTEEYQDIIINKNDNEFYYIILECLENFNDRELIDDKLFDLLYQCKDVNTMMLILA